MAEIAAGLAATVATTGGTLQSIWGYNQDCYNFDKTMQQAAMHQRQQMRREWIFLFRDDINQMVDLTILRMDNYILTNTLQITLIMAILGEGSLLPSGDMPMFATWAFMLSFTGGIVMLVLSTWMAMHASITAHSCGLSLLLQSRQVRDLPTGTEVDAFRARLQDFEETDLRKQLRIPFTKRIASFWQDPVKAVTKPQVQYHYEPDALENFYINERLEEQKRKDYHISGGQVQRSEVRGGGAGQYRGPSGAASYQGGGSSSSTSMGPQTAQNQGAGGHGNPAQGGPSSDPSTQQSNGQPRLRIRTSHLDIFRVLQKHWQHFDAYARVTNALGTYMMLNAILFFLLTYLAFFQKLWLLAWMCGALYAYLSRAVATVDLVLQRWESFTLTILQVGVVVVKLSIYTVALLASATSLWNTVLIPLSALFQFLWLSFLFYLSQPTYDEKSIHSHLPEKFRQILYIDLLAWKKLDDGMLTENRKQEMAERSSNRLSTQGGGGGGGSFAAGGGGGGTHNINSSSFTSAGQERSSINNTANMLPRSTRSSKVEETEEEKMARARRERRERLKSAVKLGADRLVDGRGQLFAQSVKKKTSIFGAISDLVLGGGTPSKSDVKVATSSEEANAANDYDDIADPAEEGGAVVRERKSTVVLGVGGAEHQGKMNNMKRKTTTNNLRQADSDKNLNANEFARDFLEVMDHCCELEAYLNTWERPSSSNRRRAGQESQGVTKDELNFSSSSDDDDNDGDNGFGLARNLRSRKSGTARPGKSTSSRRQRSSFVQGETAPLLPPPPQPDPFRDEAMKLLRRDEAVAASLRMPHKALFGSSGTTNDGNQYQGSNRENRRNSVSNDDYDNPDNTSSRLSQQSEGGDTTRAAGVSSQDLHLYREKLAVHTKEIARLLDVAGLDQALFSRVRARKREVARWVQVPDYDPNTGMYMPYYLYKDRKEIRYAVPDTPFMRQNFLEHAFEVLEENLQHLAENVTEIALEVVEEPPSSTRAEQKVDKDAVLPSHLGSESSEMKKTLETNNMKNGEATSKIVPRQNVEQGEFDNRNNGPRTSSRPVKKRNLIDRLGAWLSEKRALYETPHVIAEIETLQATATEANLLPQRLFNRVMISLLVSWAVAFATLTYQECQAYVKFLRQPPFQHADSVIQFINDPVTTAQAAAENGDGGAAGQTRIQLGVSGTTIGTAEGAPAVNSAGAAAATTGFVQIEARTADYLRSAGTTVSNVRMAAWGSEKENLAGEVARIACSQKCGRSRVVVATEYDLLNFGDSSQCAREMQSLIVREIEAQIQSPIETAAYGDYSWNGGSSFDYYNGGGGGNGGFPGMGPEMMSYYFGSDYRYNGGDQTISFGTGGGGGSGGARGNTHLTTGRNKIENFKDIIDISLDKDCNPVVLLRNSVVRCVQVGDDSADDVVHRGGAAAAAGAKQAPAKAKARAKQFRAQVLRLIGQWEGYELRPKSIFVNQDTNDIVLGVDDGTRPTLLLMVVVDPVSIGSPPDSQPLLRPTAELFYGLADVLQRYDTYWQDPNRVSIHEDHHARIRLIPEVIFMRKNPLFKGPAKCNKEAPAVLCYYEKHEDQFRYTLHAVTQLQYAMSYSGNGEIEITPNVDLVNACFLEEEDAGKGVILGISSERQIVSYKFADVFV